MNLRQLQADFLDRIVGGGSSPVGVAPGDPMERGIAIYRNNYRQALMEAMRSTFERTRRWIGGEAFAAAASHHLIRHPPSSWTLDDVGECFAQTTALLFARDPEVADLVALEWAMHRVFGAADAPLLDLPGFGAATASFGEDDWAALRLQPQPGLAVITVHTDCVALWRSLADDVRPQDPPVLDPPAVAVVWREDWRPVCCLASAEEGEALRGMIAGMRYGEVCERLADVHGPERAAQEAGRMLGWWLRSGMLAGVLRAEKPVAMQ